MDNLKEKLEILFRHMKNVYSILIVNTGTMDPNFTYITEFTSGLFEYSYLLLKRDGAVLFTSMLEYETAKSQAKTGLEVVMIKNAYAFRKRMAEELHDRIIGLNESFIPYAIYKSINERYAPRSIVDISYAFLSLRLVKDDGEVRLIRKAVSITKMAMILIQKEFREGISELELAAKFDSISASLGSECPSFKTIVCFGENAAYPHHFPSNTKLGYGDFILIDAGARFGNYASDITRTFVFGDRSKKRVSNYIKKDEMQHIVKEAQLAAIKMIRPGAIGKDVHMAAQRVIDTASGGLYKGRFIHSLGHSVGIEVHDGEGFSPKSKLVLKPGMVITVEPGIYIPGFGGVRIEDDVLVTKSGALVL